MAIFLTAEWRDLALLNYIVDPALLEPFVPPATELDFCGGKAWISLVGFRFLRTRLLGVRVPFHHNFPEVNMRFYVRRREGGAVRRGVVFLREIVPRRAIAAVARLAYHENYLAVPMSSLVEPDRVEYRWRHGGSWTSLHLEASGEGAPAEEGSHQQFITEHYWGYSRRLEYEVRHPVWRVRAATRAWLDGDTSSLYGPDFARILARQPDSAFLADGSTVTVFRPRRLAD